MNMKQLSRQTAAKKQPPKLNYKPVIDSLKEAKTGRPKTERNITAIIRDIENGGPFDRWHACVDVHDLAGNNPEEARKAVPSLIKAFEKWGIGTMCIIAETFKALGDPRALRVLARHVDHVSDDVRIRVRDAMSSIPVTVLEVIRS